MKHLMGLLLFLTVGCATLNAQQTEKSNKYLNASYFTSSYNPYQNVKYHLVTFTNLTAQGNSNEYQELQVMMECDGRVEVYSVNMYQTGGYIEYTNPHAKIKITVLNVNAPTLTLTPIYSF
jgi:hypothetical protein